MPGLLYGAPAGKELHINCNDYTETEVLAMPFWERLIQELDKLDRQAHEILQKEFPDDEDIPGLPLTDITIGQVRLLRDIFPLLRYWRLSGWGTLSQCVL
mgnify:CR=1 FL=1